MYGQAASYRDRVEPYSYYMSRFNKTGDKRMISIPEFGAYVALVNFLNDKKDLILRACIECSQKDENSFSRFINDSGELIDFDSTYGDAGFILKLDDSRESNEYEKERSVYISNMIYKIQKTRGAAGILHIDISEFYRNIYTHILGCIKLGIYGVKEAFLRREKSSDYTLFNDLDKMVRSLNGARTNGLLVGPYISRILAEGINDVLYKQLKYNIKNGNNLGVVWLVYVLVNMGYEFGREDVIQFLETKNELAIIILLEEKSELFDDQLADECWNKSNCWLMLYQIALRFKEKREIFSVKLNIPVNKGFYEKLFKAEFSFYKKTMVGAKTDLQATDQQVNSYTPALPVIFDDDDDWSDLLEV